MHIRLLPLLLAAALLAGCSDDMPPSAAPRSSPSESSATTTDPFTAIAPPTARAVGPYGEVLVNRALQNAQGLLAFQLFEDSSLTGTDKAGLVEALTGVSGGLTLARDLGGAPTARGLGYRPLFAAGVTVDAGAATVERSVWTTDAVQGLGGEQGLRVSWSGSVRYATTVEGRSQEVAFAVTIGYVYATVQREPNGIELAQVVPGSSHAAPVLASCLSEGVLLPVEGTPTAADLGPGPWTRPTGGGPCPA